MYRRYNDLKFIFVRAFDIGVPIILFCFNLVNKKIVKISKE